MSFRRWSFAPLDKQAAAELAQACEIDSFAALLLAARGITDPEAAAALLRGDEELEDPFAFADMDIAAERIQRAIDDGETIAVFGDYDADGVTATVLMVTYLHEKGAKVYCRIPRREDEGYGLHPSTVDEIAATGLSPLLFPLQDSGDLLSGDVFDEQCDLRFGPVYDREKELVYLYICDRTDTFGSYS